MADMYDLYNIFLLVWFGFGAEKSYSFTHWYFSFSRFGHYSYLLLFRDSRIRHLACVSKAGTVHPRVDGRDSWSACLKLLLLLKEMAICACSYTIEAVLVRVGIGIVLHISGTWFSWEKANLIFRNTFRNLQEQIGRFEVQGSDATN